jgi:hypothetical protein
MRRRKGPLRNGSRDAIAGSKIAADGVGDSAPHRHQPSVRRCQLHQNNPAITSLAVKEFPGSGMRSARPLNFYTRRNTRSRLSSKKASEL